MFKSIGSCRGPGFYLLHTHTAHDHLYSFQEFNILFWRPWILNTHVIIRHRRRQNTQSKTLLKYLRDIGNDPGHHCRFLRLSWSYCNEMFRSTCFIRKTYYIVIELIQPHNTNSEGSPRHPSTVTQAATLSWASHLLLRTEHLNSIHSLDKFVLEK